MTTLNIPKEQSTESIKIRFDIWIALAVATLVIAGMMVVYSSSYDVAFRSPLSNNDHAYYFKRQVVALLLGLLGIVTILQVDYTFFRKLSVLSMVVTLTLLGAVLAFGDANFGATRGLFGNSVQPSEFAKITMILYASHWLSSKSNRLKNLFTGLLPFGVIVGVVCTLIVYQPDLSTTLLIAIISFTLFFLAGADFFQFIIAGVIIVVAAVAMTTVLDYADARVDAWQDAFRNPAEGAYQIKLAALSIGSGGMTGRGLGQGAIKYELPAAHTDGPFAVWAEETGFLGSLFIIFWYGFLAWRGFLAAQRARTQYGYLLAMGVTCWISFQALLNIAVITSLIPFTGMPLPFMSYGGTGLLTTLLGVGILLNVSRDALIPQSIRATMPQLPQDDTVQLTRDTNNTENPIEITDQWRRYRGSRLSGSGRGEQPAEDGSDE